MTTIENLQPPVVVSVDQPVLVIEPGAGLQGPPGPAGPPGATGAPGGAYVHSQGAADTVWQIAHGLGFYPNVTALDATGEEIEGDLDYISANLLTITYSYAISGVAYLS